MAKQPDWEAIRERCALAGLPSVVYHHLHMSGEAFVSGVVRGLLSGSSAHLSMFGGEVPEVISAEAEFPVPRGRIDYLLIHADGSLTVCELKDGARGKQHVLSGLGQCIGYAVQLGMANAGVPTIRKALVFSSWGKPDEELLVVQACRDAGVIPVPMGSEAAHRDSAMRFIERYISNGSEKVH
ncbi:hypothetical protein [Stutzerimonas stutzeri]|uniref:hypothetical protein n=1 Tax=Stutzerimonas stutzeri TaxID=316 RepID=UPI00244D46DA|nr:hypothetical protein [Stutzerimonas stutzeri]MDH0157344.1 hypothetical protein [Stutzerimonas stutzeri]